MNNEIDYPDFAIDIFPKKIFSNFLDIGFDIEIIDKNHLKIQNNHKKISETWEYVYVEGLNIKNFDFYIYENSYHIKNKIFISNNFSEKLTEKFRINNIYYLDYIGNCWIYSSDFLLFIHGKKIKITPENLKVKKKKRFWTYTQAKLVFALLVIPDLLHQNYRNLSNILGISLGAISQGIEALENENFIVEKSKNEKKLVNQKKLLNNFLLNFQECITPKNQQKTYKILDNNFFKTRFSELFLDNNQFKLNENTFFYAGEYLAETFTPYIMPEIHTFYGLNHTQKEMMKYFHLLPDINGNVILKNKFWSDDLESELIKSPIFLPLLAYIDLTESCENRNIEITQIIYEKYLSSYFEW